MNIEEATMKLILESKYYQELQPKVEDTDRDNNTIKYFEDQIKNNIHEPILINSDDEVLDGNHRLKAYQNLNIEPPLLYRGERKDFYNVGEQCRWDGIEMIKAMIKNGTATKI